MPGVLLEKSVFEPMEQRVERDTREFACGWGAAFINITITFPMNKAMFRQQLLGIKTWQAVSDLKKEGLRNLYRGLLPPLLQKTTSLSIMFGSYDYYLKHLNQQSTNYLLVNKILAANLAGCTEAILAPFERVQVILQDKKFTGQFKNTLHAFRAMKSYGIREYYRGISTIFLRNGPSNAIFFTLRGPFKQSLPTAETSFGNTMNDFISGGVLGAMCSTLFYPLNVVKTRMMAKVGGKHVGIYESFHTIFNERRKSWRKMFRGVHLNYTRSMLSWGIINASYELLKKFLVKEEL